VAAAAGTGTSAWASAGGFPVPQSAVAAWAAAGQETEPRRFALAQAIFAPNSHNLQPWRADLSPRPANTVQMLARLGHLPEGASEQPPAPRRAAAWRHI
jgi:hypothetical protein